MKKIFKSFVSISTIITVAFSPMVSLSPAVFAANTGFQVPVTASIANNYNDWDTKTVANIQISDDVYVSDNDEGNNQGYEDFGFSVTSGSTINGIEVSAEAKSSDSSGCQLEVALSWNNGSNFSSMKTAALTGSDALYSFGGSLDTWDHPWTSSQFSDANFVARISFDDVSGTQCQNSTVSVDQLQIKVYYTEPVQPATNPQLGQSCGLDIALVLDSSGSISTSELTQMKNAFGAFVDAFLPETPTQFSVTDFGDTATVLQSFTSNVSLITTAINTPTSGGYTNWEDGLLKAQSTFDPRLNPNLVIFASDGNPNRIGNNQQVSETAAVSAAVAVANALKNSGTRILALGIGNDLDINNLKAISGPNVNTGTSSDVITTNFATLAQDLAALASQLCGGTINAHKTIDVDGNLATTDDQSDGSGWSFDVAGSPKLTHGDGYTDPVEVNSGTYSVSETLVSGYSLIDASCGGSSGSNGTLDIGTRTISGIYVGNQDIVSCIFYNSPQCIPTTEVCDGADNDCDGLIDEDISPVPTNCGVGACGSSGELICYQGSLVDTCQAGTPSAEVCDNIDNNCDGTVDENLTQQTFCGSGICSGNQGYETCTAGVWGGDTCNPYGGAGTEICEGSSDENCDGAVDEGCDCINGQVNACGDVFNIGLCQQGTQTCTDGMWGQCVGVVYPADEICGNGLDEDCDGSDLQCPLVTINAYKVVCQTETDLPNRGNGGPNITANTATDYVSQNQNCQLTSGWDFEWAYASTENPGDNIIGPAGSPWTTFGPTDGNGLIITNINSLSGDRIWVREVMKEGYIPFSGDTTAPRDNVSAELYCHQDVLNYDNYDFILNPQLDNTYYCVGFNVPTAEPEPTGTVSGHKYNDLNQNGAWDEGEPGLGGWNIWIDLNGNGVYDGNDWQTTSDGSNGGLYAFPLVAVGTYDVCEIMENHTGWATVNPLCQSVTVTENETSTANFFNYEEITPTPGSISGIKFNDLEGDILGPFEGDVNDPLLSGWKIYFDQNDDNTWNEGEPFVITNENGEYSFTDLLPSTYVVREVMQEGWTQTMPGASNQEEYVMPVNIGGFGGNHQHADFGNYQTPISVCGNGIKEGSEQCDGTAGVGEHQICNQDCTLSDIPYCGDETCNGGETCSTCPGDCGACPPPVCLGCYGPPYCGDGTKNGSEECDDGNIFSGDGCSADCKTEGGLVAGESICTMDVDVMVVMDVSGSMGEDSPTRLSLAQIAANSFIDNLRSSDQSGVVSFNRTATLNKNLSYDHVSTQSIISGLTAGGSTNIGDAIDKANNELMSVANDLQLAKVEILLTDGRANRPNGDGLNENPADVALALAESLEAAENGIMIYTVGLGSDVNTGMLQTIANNTGGKYYFSPISNDLNGIFSQIAAETCRTVFPAYVSPAITIFNERAGATSDTGAIVTWYTNIPATSRVVYGNQQMSVLGEAPNYGYAFSTPEQDSVSKVIPHSVTISGLIPNTTYYARCVSQTAKSTELTFTTLGAGEVIPIIPAPEEGEVAGAETEEEVTVPTEPEAAGGEEAFVTEGAEAAVGGFVAGGTLCWILFIITILVNLWYLWSKRKGTENKNRKWVLPVIILVLLILYYFLCCTGCVTFWVLVIINAILFALSLFIRQKQA